MEIPNKMIGGNCMEHMANAQRGQKIQRAMAQQTGALAASRLNK